jgi:hypothetical protein
MCKGSKKMKKDLILGLVVCLALGLGVMSCDPDKGDNEETKVVAEQYRATFEFRAAQEWITLEKDSYEWRIDSNHTKTGKAWTAGADLYVYDRGIGDGGDYYLFGTFRDENTLVGEYSKDEYVRKTE